MKSDNNTLYSHGGKVYQPAEDPFFFRLEEVALTPATSTYQWKGAKIPWELWEKCVNFLIYTQKKFKSESVITFYYNTEKNEWAVHAFPQGGHGMTVSRIHNDVAKEQRAWFNDDWIEFGSIHHHCNASAFQSGTDHADEHDREGVHITIGNLEEAELDFDGRLILNGTKHKFNSAFDWVDLPEGYKLELPNWQDSAIDELKRNIFDDYLMRTCIYDAKNFPETWKKNFVHAIPKAKTYKANTYQGKQSTFPYEKKTTTPQSSGMGYTTKNEPEAVGIADTEEETKAHLQELREQEAMVIEIHACIQATCAQYGIFSSDLMNNWETRWDDGKIVTPFPDDAQSILDGLSFLEEQLEELPFNKDADELMDLVLFE